MSVGKKNENWHLVDKFQGSLDFKYTCIAFKKFFVKQVVKNLNYFWRIKMIISINKKWSKKGSILFLLINFLWFFLIVKDTWKSQFVVIISACLDMGGLKHPFLPYLVILVLRFLHLLMGCHGRAFKGTWPVAIRSEDLGSIPSRTSSL